MGKQLCLDLHRGSWGGRRAKSGRKRIHSKGVAHRERETVNSKVPMHVNFKYKINIRNKEILKILKRAIFNSRRKGLRILHYSVQRNHMHFIVEADSNQILESGMRSLTVTIAKRLKKGSLQIKRYHLHVLRSIREAKNAIRYVVFNEQRHTGKKTVELSEYSSFHVLDVRVMAKKEKLTLVMKKIVSHFMKDVEKSFLAKKALEQLVC